MVRSSPSRSATAGSNPTNSRARRHVPGGDVACYSSRVLPPTSPDLLLDESRPYFLWWADLTVGDFRRQLRSGTDEERAYWLGALLREANTRDVWLFSSPREIRALWPLVYRHLGRSRDLWCHLLQLAAPAGEAAAE
ncbi:MAG TPA: hypothetical protein PLU22_26240 [Polyangiaceae bacterium]|nr:hypothetical protein [Polyangiaceae bacterium]